MNTQLVALHPTRPAAFQVILRWALVLTGTALSLTLIPHPLLAQPPADSGPPPRWERNDSNLYFAEGNVGIGTDSPTERLTVEGDVKVESGTVCDDNGCIGDSQWEEGSTGVLSYDGGKVVIGESDPLALLTLREKGDGPSSMLVLRRDKSAGNGYQAAVFRLDPTASVFHLDVGGTENSRTRIHLGDPEFPHNPVTMLGKVGIGKAAPETELDVVGTTRTTAIELRSGADEITLRGGDDQDLIVESDDPGLVIRDGFGDDSREAARLELLERSRSGSTEGAVLFWNGASDQLLIGSKKNNVFRQGLVFDDATGNVGIGTSSPGAKLHVNGTTRISHLEHLASLGDKISLYGDRFGQANMYGFGIAHHTLYYKAAGNHRWFVNSNSDGNPTMNLGHNSLLLQGRDPVLQIRDNSRNNSPRAARLELVENAGGNFDGGAFLQWNGSTNRLLIGTENGGNSSSVLSVDRSSGGVGIGTEDPDGYRLAVNGKIRAKEVVVETGWADFVFEADYPLRSLAEVEDFIAEHGHLPDMPSAGEIAEHGVSLGEAQTLLLRKVEELTLYLVKLRRDIDTLSADNQRLRAELRSKGLPLQQRTGIATARSGQ